jgi:hypothetical protein
MEIEVINNNKEYITTNDDDTNFTNNTETNTNTNTNTNTTTNTDTNTNTNTRWAKTNFVDLQSSPCIFFLRFYRLAHSSVTNTMQIKRLSLFPS